MRWSCANAAVAVQYAERLLPAQPPCAHVRQCRTFSLYGLFWNSSGAMYCGVPAPAWALVLEARPKSHTWEGEGRKRASGGQGGYADFLQVAY